MAGELRIAVGLVNGFAASTAAKLTLSATRDAPSVARSTPKVYRRPMRALSILLLSDGRPGHYHLAEGVAAAIARQRPVEVVRVSVARRRLLPGRLLTGMLGTSAGPGAVLRAGYGLTRGDLPAKADLVISAGGETIAANVAATRLLGAHNIFCGTLRRVAPEAFSLIVSSYARHATLPRHLVALKPNGIDPDTLRRRDVFDPASGKAPAVAGLLVGGDSGLFHYTQAEWRRLIEFLGSSYRRNGIRWVVSTSRRSPDWIGDAIASLATERDSPIAELIDFRTAGPGTLPKLFGAVEAILCTEDSSTMLSEAVCARLPVVGVSPGDHGFKDDEREYRAFMRDQGWCRFLGLDALEPETFMKALAGVQPLTENHLDRLAGQLAERVPELFQ